MPRSILKTPHRSSQMDEDREEPAAPKRKVHFGNEEETPCGRKNKLRFNPMGGVRRPRPKALDFFDDNPSKASQHEGDGSKRSRIQRKAEKFIKKCVDDLRNKHTNESSFDRASINRSRPASRQSRQVQVDSADDDLPDYEEESPTPRIPASAKGKERAHESAVDTASQKGAVSGDIPPPKSFDLSGLKRSLEASFEIQKDCPTLSAGPTAKGADMAVDDSAPIPGASQLKSTGLFTGPTTTSLTQPNPQTTDMPSVKSASPSSISALRNATSPPSTITLPQVPAISVGGTVSLSMTSSPLNAPKPPISNIPDVISPPSIIALPQIPTIVMNSTIPPVTSSNTSTLVPPTIPSAQRPVTVPAAPQPVASSTFGRSADRDSSKPLQAPRPASSTSATLAPQTRPQQQSTLAPPVAPIKALDKAVLRSKILEGLKTTSELDTPPPSISRTRQQSTPAVSSALGQPTALSNHGPTHNPSSTPVLGSAPLVTPQAQSVLSVPLMTGCTPSQRAPLQSITQNVPQSQVQPISIGSTWLDQALSLYAKPEVAVMSSQPTAFALVPVLTNVAVPKKPLPSPKERKELQGGDENASGGFYNSIKSSPRKKGAVKRAPLAAKMTVPETSPLASSKRSRKPEPKQRPAVSPLTLSAHKPTVAKKSQPEDVAQEEAQKSMAKSVVGHSNTAMEGHTYIKKLVNEFSSMHPEMPPQPLVASLLPSSPARLQKPEAAPVRSARLGYSTSTAYLDQSVPFQLSEPIASSYRDSSHSNESASHTPRHFPSSSTLVDDSFIRNILADAGLSGLDIDSDYSAYLTDSENGISIPDPSDKDYLAEGSTNALAEATSAVGFVLGRTVAAVASLFV